MGGAAGSNVSVCARVFRWGAAGRAFRSGAAGGCE